MCRYRNLEEKEKAKIDGSANRNRGKVSIVKTIFEHMQILDSVPEYSCRIKWKTRKNEIEKKN